MSISALSSTSALSFLSRLSSTNNISSQSGSAEGVRPPPPPEGGGFADAIAEALKSIGVTDDAGADTSAASASTETSDSATNDATDVAAALGSFLQSLMGALHAQNSAGAETPPPYGEQQGGPGKLESDLQSLIARLTSTDGAAATESGDSVDQLESSFANLLDKLGVSTDSGDSTDSASKLAAFLQTLSTKVDGHGVSGNLVNTTV
ncbi:hypothetical protein FHW83_005556 [Duganella sp. SG902]|uniref:hypothetical protein n=1 Tax=Duganella sp. SG902 TaxID=2587016 RepID=UPI00159D4C8B|nr:hypothetical protein [Duganella sp. SG902]NVM79715.1 hypothetical protein [Duganella sp. SG902]